MAQEVKFRQRNGSIGMSMLYWAMLEKLQEYYKSPSYNLVVKQLIEKDYVEKINKELTQKDLLAQAVYTEKDK